MDGRASADLSDLQKRQWPAVAGRIREARLRAGLSDTEVARQLSMTVASYDDLELRGDEVFTVASLRQVETLGRILAVSPRVLLLGPEAEGLRQTVTFAEISSRLARHAKTRGETVEQLVDAIGWDIKELLDDPDALWSFNVEGLYDICRTIGVDWVGALPESTPASQG